MAVLLVEGLSKSFHRGLLQREVRALDGLNLEVERGEIFGFLGPNGAGKTTTLKLLLRLIYPTRGRASIMGTPIDDRSCTQYVGYMPENPYFYRFLTGEEFIRFYGRLNGFSRSTRATRTKEILRLVGMEDAAGVRIGEYSKGMVQRIGLGQALLADPDLLLLDEPLSGVDPIGRADIRDCILRLREKGKTIFLCSHILSDVEAICDRVAILDRGKLLRTGTIQELITSGKRTFEAQMTGHTAQDLTRLSVIAEKCEERGGRLHLTLDSEERVRQMLEGIHGTDISLLSLQERKEDLESYFMRLIEGAKQT